MANEQNLKPFSSVSIAREMGRIGGIKAGEAKRKKAAMRDIIAAAFGYRSELSEDEIKHYEEMGMDADDINNQAKAIMQQIKKAAEGDLNALVFLRDTVGEKPKDAVNLTHAYAENFEIVVEDAED